MKYLGCFWGISDDIRVCFNGIIKPGRCAFGLKKITYNHVLNIYNQSIENSGYVHFVAEPQHYESERAGG